MKSIKQWIEALREQSKCLKNPDSLTQKNMLFMGWKQEHLNFAANHLENFARAMEEDIKELYEN